MSGALLTEIRKMAEEVATREGCFLYDLEFNGTGAGRTLRVTIDKEIEGGASIEDCSNVSRGLNLMLDVEDVIPGGEYQLEVSTPGLERVLKEPRHFERVIGKTISVNSFVPLLDFNPEVVELGKAKRVQGKLISFDEKNLKVAFVPDGADTEKEISVPLESVTKAHVVFEFADPNVKPGQKPGSKKGPKKGGHKK